MIREFAAGELNDANLKELHRLRVAIDLEDLPDDTPVHFDEMVAELAGKDVGSRNRRWIAWQGSAAVGYGSLNLDLQDNLHLGWSWVCVDPGFRRRGVATSMLRVIAAALQSEQRTSLGLDFRHGSEGAIVAPRFGFEEKSVEHHNRTTVGKIDAAMIDSWVARSTERATGYELRFWESPTLTADLGEYARVFNVMNTAPRDELDMEDRHMTSELMHDREAQLPIRGVQKWVMAAVAPDGSFSGFSEIFFSNWRDDVCYQGNTGVDPAHRNLGLGRWLKAAMFLQLRERRPAVTKIDTWNAGSNEPMLAINHAMGFAPINVWANAQADLAVVRSQLERRNS